jgi:hypothetical protein
MKTCPKTAAPRPAVEGPRWLAIEDTKVPTGLIALIALFAHFFLKPLRLFTIPLISRRGLSLHSSLSSHIFYNARSARGPG